MPRNITLSIPLVAALGWLLMTIGLVVALADALATSLDGFGLAGVCVALVGRQILSHNLISHVEQQVQANADREIAAFELGRRAELSRVK